MSGTNRYLAAQAATRSSPITFTTTAGSANTGAMVATNNANLDQIIALISLEEADASVNRQWLDEMSPAARITVYKILIDLKAATIA